MCEQVFDIAIVGGGIVGLASAYKIQKKFPNLKIVIFEKENTLAEHQTGRNSGVLHSGLYYKPGSFKAKNCVNGRREMVQFARDHSVPHDVCGKIVVAANKGEIPFLNKIYENGLENMVEDVQKISADEIREIEPHCHGVGGLWVGCTGIIDFVAVAKKLAELIKILNKGSEIKTGCEVLALEKGEVNTIHTSKGKFLARRMVFCAGLQSDRMAKKDNINPNMKIVGFRGDYYELSEKGRHKVKNLIYPVPNPAFPFLGVHFTRMTNGEIECGPNAVFTFKREGYSKISFSLRDTLDALSYKGTWKLFGRHWRFGLEEYKRAFSKKLFLNRLQQLIPGLRMDDIKTGRAGVRAMALGTDGEMIDDFKIEYKDQSIHVLNAPSPAATAALAIGEEVCDLADKYFQLSLAN